MAKTAPRDKAGDAPLILERLAYAYPESPESPILRDINLELRDGERIGLTGANGSGKTTLFRCITGLSRPAGGALFLESRRIVSEKDFQYLRRRVGYVLQNSDDQLIFPTVMEDLIFGPLNLGFSPEVAKLKAEETMSALGISGFGDRISWKMSGGEKKLAAIASILVMRPRILLLDEPLNELDEKAAKRIRDTVANLECAQIIISHDADFLKDIGATIVELKDGILVRE